MLNREKFQHKRIYKDSLKIIRDKKFATHPAIEHSELQAKKPVFKT